MTPFLSVVIPAYNEERRLPPTLDKTAAYLLDSLRRPAEILVVNDGSTDRTAEAVREAAGRLAREGLRIELIENPGNQGKGYSVRHGMLEAAGEWALFTDADLSSPIEEADKLFEAVRRGPHDIAFGSRALDRSLVGKRQPLLREMAGRMFNVFVRLGAGLPFADTQCGFKLFSRRAARAVFSKQRMDGFGFDVEVLYLARKLGFSAVEVPVRWFNVEGTTVSTLDGLDAFLDIARVRWNDLRGRYG